MGVVDAVKTFGVSVCVGGPSTVEFAPVACMNARMEWDNYQHILALSRARTLSAAAAELGVARTTVGRRLDAIEDALSVRLFDRTPEGFVPTAAGESLIAVAREFEDAALAAEAEVRGRDAALQGDLRVSTLDFLYELDLDRFSAFTERYPGVSLTVCASTDHASLRRREADVVIRLSDTPAPHLVGRRLTTMGFNAFAHRDLVERAGPNAPLSAFPWVGEDQRAATPWMDAFLAEVAPGTRIAIRFDVYATTRAAVRAGVGASFLPVAEAALDPNLVRIGPLEDITRDLWVLTLAELRTSTRVRAFMDHMWTAFRG